MKMHLLLLFLFLLLLDLRFLCEANLSIVILPHLLSIISIKLEVVTQLCTFLLNASTCILYFRGIQKTKSIILRAKIILKMFSASSCNSSLLFPLFKIKLLICIPENNIFFEPTFRGFQGVMNHF